MVAIHALAALFLSMVATISASPIDSQHQPSKRCTATISSYTDIATAVSSKCTTVVVNSFTVPAGKPFDLSGLTSGTTVNVQGDVTFAAAEWSGPMFTIDGEGITFQGNGHTFDGQGKSLWDTLGSNGGKTKVFSIGSNSAQLIIDTVTIDNSAGDELSGGKTLGHNTDCFDVSATNVIIKNSRCVNQDDCLAINKGSAIQFLNNYCSGLESRSAATPSSKVIMVFESRASVSSITYTGNTVTSAAKYGVVIQQDYENGSPTGTPTNGVSISDINFTGTNTVSAAASGKEVYVLCGSGSCKGTWDWAGLKVSGGSKGSITGNPPIKNFSL
ncbi:hypothetical protein QFC20_004476 [Naganishia adeliensis]|uniref:Uncharacterized protein n=1 Tax=Naganishia adeliensis TaxID=92952 RepID=A0ACC2W065_9TREE|nr:hypothetical protein QFC20_004476 [Naganishia adeliensis]